MLVHQRPQVGEEARGRLGIAGDGLHHHAGRRPLVVAPPDEDCEWAVLRDVHQDDGKGETGERPSRADRGVHVHGRALRQRRLAQQVGERDVRVVPARPRQPEHARVDAGALEHRVERELDVRELERGQLLPVDRQLGDVAAEVRPQLRRDRRPGRGRLVQQLTHEPREIGAKLVVPGALGGHGPTVATSRAIGMGRRGPDESGRRPYAITPGCVNSAGQATTRSLHSSLSMATTDELLTQIDGKISALLTLVLDAYLRDTGVARPRQRSVDKMLSDAGLSAATIAKLLGKTDRAVHLQIQADRQKKSSISKRRVAKEGHP